LGTTIMALGLLAGGSDAENTGRASGGPVGAGGKADDADAGNEVLGTTEVKVTVAGDPFSERQAEVLDHQVYVNGRAVEVNEWVEVEYTGRDCLTVVSKNPLGDELVTENCEQDLRPDPGAFDGQLLGVQMVKFDIVPTERFDPFVDFGWGFDRFGLGGEGVISVDEGERVTVGEGSTHLIAPGEYTLTLGAYEELAEPEPWQELPLFLNGVDDLSEGLTLSEDLRSRITIFEPLEVSSLPPARAASGCSVDIDMWVDWDTGNRSYGRELGEHNELYFMPYPGARYSLRIAGLVVEDTWRNEDGEVYYEYAVDTYTHEIPTGPSGERGTFRIWKQGDEDAQVQCFGGMEFGSNSTFEVGGHVILPAGAYVEEIRYDGIEPIVREFTLG